MAHRIDMIEGSSIDPEVIARVQAIAAEHQRILVCLDSTNHTHDHVLARGGPRGLPGTENAPSSR